MSEGYLTAEARARVEIERFRCFAYEGLVSCDTANLGITGLLDGSLDDAALLPSPGVLVTEIVEVLEAALAQFAELAASLPVEAAE